MSLLDDVRSLHAIEWLILGAFVAIVLAIAIPYLCGYRPPESPTPAVNLARPAADPHVRVLLIGTFSDELAYGGQRGIYRIDDQETGKSFLGISGVGIAERSVCTRQIGKTAQSLPDER